MPSIKILMRIVTIVCAIMMVRAVAPAETQSLETLLAYMKSPDAATRRDAAHKLGERRIRTQLVVEALSVAARKDEDYGTRAEAVQSLGKIKDFSAMPEMIEVVKDPHEDVRRMAIRSLVMLYTEHDIDFITNRRTGWNMFNPFLDTNDHEIIEPYIFVDPAIIQALGDAARSDRNRDIRVAATRALGVLRGAMAIAQLADALNADQDMRIDVIRSFIKIGDERAGQYLVPFFHDSNQNVRTQAMVAAGLLKYRPAVEPLLSVYGLGPEKHGTFSKITGSVKGIFSYNPSRDEAALWALSLIGDDRAEQTFVENLADKDSDRRKYAVEGLARIGDQRYKDQISRLVLTEKNGDVKLAEQWALYKMGDRASIQFIVRKLDTDQAEQARSYLLEVNDATDLYPYLRTSNTDVSRSVIEILGRIGNQETVKELEPIARTSGADTANTATVAIKQIEWRQAGRPRATDSVLQKETRPRRAANP